MTEVICEQCGKSSRGMIILRDSFGGERHLCRNCYNDEMAKILGVENYKNFIKNYQGKDVSGKLHTFEIHHEIFSLGIKWLANEIKDGEEEGYQFGLYAKLNDNPVDCLQRLYRKIDKGLSNKYVKKEKAGGYTLYSLPHDKIVGRIEWDDNYNGEIPKVIIDGKTYTWNEVGKMLMTYEGWNLTIEVHEVGEDED